MTMCSVYHVEEAKKDLVKYVHRLGRLLEYSPNGGSMFHNNSKSYLEVEVKSKQHIDPLLMELNESVLGKLNESFSERRDGELRYQGRLCVPDFYDLRK